METVKIIPKSDYIYLKQIVEEYLSLSNLEKICEQFPSAVVGYYIDDKLIGVCFGFEIDDENFTLDGIAIIEPYNAKGRGGRLISLFEQNVSALGYKNISLGSADGYVERFYIKNGYTPIELKIYSQDDWEEKSKNSKYPIAYTQKEGDKIKLVIKVDDYNSMNKAEITKYYNGKDSFFVFEKRIKA